MTQVLEQVQEVKFAMTVPVLTAAALVEMVASVVAMGFTADMARVALQNEGSVEGAVDQLMTGGGVVAPSHSQGGRGKRRRRDEEDEEAYNRIKEDITDNEEDHLDLDLVEEGQLLQQYLSLLHHVQL